MKSILIVLVIFGTLGTLTEEINARTITGIKTYSDVSKPVEVSVSCKCDGVHAEYRFPIREDTLKDVMEMIQEERTTKGCAKCTVNLLTCHSFYNSINSCDKTQIFEFGRYVPSDVNTYMNENPAGMNRSRREIEGVGACNFPRNLKTAHLSCTEYPNKIKCTQRCIFGHTLDEGISRDMKCEFTENAWKPMGFQECNPFIDCSMTLVGTGNKSCLVGTTDLPSVCNVTCGDYEDKVATPLDTFECQLHGGWNKPLPHCVISGSGFALVTPPKVKAHSPAEKDENKKMAMPQKTDKPQKVYKPQAVNKPQTVDKPQPLEKPQAADKPQAVDKPQTVDVSEKAEKPQKHIKPKKSTSKAAPQNKR